MSKESDKLSVRNIYTGDNLPILRSMDSQTVDLIYLDPPFNSGKQWANPIKARGKTALAEFKDTWSLDDIHADHDWQMLRDCPAAVAIIDTMAEINGVSWHAYLIYMGVRLLEMKRILKPNGSIYYHCDPVMSHGVKLLMDAIFGGGGTKSGGNFRNEIIWGYSDSPSATTKDFPRKHDVILRYVNGKKYIFNKKDVSVPYAESSINRIKYAANKSTVMSGTAIKLRADGKIPPSVWSDIRQAYRYRESTGYPTQKPLALLERIIKASSNEGDLVLDPFCGCATTCVAAERLKRNWIGIDLSEEAATIVIDRLSREVESPLADPEAIVKHLRKLPERTDLVRTNDRVLRPQLYRQQSSKCNGCEDKLELRHLENDHIVDKNRGGQDEDINIQLLCGNCNRTKGNRGMQYLLRKIGDRMRQEFAMRLQERRIKRVSDWERKK